MAIPRIDTFERADENPLASPWTDVTGYFANLKLVSGDVLPVTGGTENVMYHSGETWPSTVYARVTIGALTAGEFDAGPVVRAGAADGNAYFVAGNGTSNIVTGKWTAGVYEGISNGNIDAALQIGDTLELRAHNNGTSVILDTLHNKSRYRRDTVTSGFLTGSPGIFAYGAADGIEAWEAGSFITEAFLGAGTPTNATTSGTHSVGTVATGQLVVVMVAKQTYGTADAFQAGDLTQSAGTATLSSFTLDATDGGAYDTGAYGYIAMFSAIVTSGGTLTVEHAGMPSGSRIEIAAEAFNPASGRSWGTSRVDVLDTFFDASDGQTGIVSDGITSTGAALFAAGMTNFSAGAGNITTNLAARVNVVYENDSGATNLPCSFYQTVSTEAKLEEPLWAFDHASPLGSAALVVAYKDEAAGGQAPRSMHQYRLRRT